MCPTLDNNFYLVSKLPSALDLTKEYKLKVSSLLKKVGHFNRVQGTAGARVVTVLVPWAVVHRRHSGKVTTIQ